jgi:glutamate formiminotransferase/formiminotetrahydrofolate cyclodeaminase
MLASLEAMEIAKAMAEIGNPNSVSDAGVGALAARSAVMGAYLNVKINAAGLSNKSSAEKLINDGATLQAQAQALEETILKTVNEKIG